MKPATPLPWAVSDNPRYVVNADHQSACLADEDAAYIAHTANAYPRLVAMIWRCRNQSDDTFLHAEIDALLGELGEL